MSNGNLEMRDILEAKEAIANAHQHISTVIMTPGEYRAICKGIVALERQVKTLRDDNRQLMEQIETRGHKTLITENTKDTEVKDETR